ncbi:MAG: Maf family protein [Planctomycetota bacterium]|nr:Maf family protein [Planctomycetota bacterium]
MNVEHESRLAAQAAYPAVDRRLGGVCADTALEKVEVPISLIRASGIGALSLPRLTERAATAMPRLLLASRSPRRRELLAAAGIDHVAAAPSFDDSALSPGKVASPANWVMSLAYLKAWAQALAHPEAPVVLGSDTACVMDGAMIGTPQTLGEARTMIRAFANREHEVVTGVALIDRRDGGTPRRHLFCDSALVTMGSLSDADLETYLAGGHWHGKAGGYNLLERIDAGWPLTYQGDPTTIMGLPMNRLVDRLNNIFG